MNGKTRHLFKAGTGLTAAALALMLVACGGGTGDPPTAAPTPAPAPGPGPSPAPSPGPSPAPSPPPTPPIARTAAGVPEGLPASATIGAAGGSLMSSDGTVTVVVPPGALAAGTQVGIQPITATAPGALGAYRLTPEGQTFAQPVTITFSYSADEAGATAPDSMRIATHDARGYWAVVGTTRDATQRTLAVTTTHFSDWSHVDGRQIVPASATVAVNKEQRLSVIDCGDGPDPDGGNSQQRLLLECLEDEELQPLPPSNWSVNAIPGGNSTVGTIAAVAGGATYKAPSSVPSQNPVAVSAQYGTGTGRVTLVSNIKVVDALTVYTGTIFGRIDTTIQGQHQFVEMSANLRFTYNPDLSYGGTKWYDGTGSAFVRGRSFGCIGDGSGTAPVQGATLTLHNEGSLAGTYAISAGALATVTMTCGDPPQQVTIALQGGAGAGGNDICPSLQIGNDPGRLVGSWSCNVAEGSTQRANWTVRAVE